MGGSISIISDEFCSDFDQEGTDYWVVCRLKSKACFSILTVTQFLPAQESIGCLANSRAHIEYERKQAEADLRKSSSSLAEKIRDLSRKRKNQLLKTKMIPPSMEKFGYDLYEALKAHFLSNWLILVWSMGQDFMKNFYLGPIRLQICYLSPSSLISQVIALPCCKYPITL